MLASEFMVEEHELRKEKIQEDYNDKYWDQRYTVVQRQIPSFLQQMAGKVLSTGEPRASARHALAVCPVALSLCPCGRAGAPLCTARAGTASTGPSWAWPLSQLTPVALGAVILSPDPGRLSYRCLLHF